jgi:hypothetical protein
MLLILSDVKTRSTNAVSNLFTKLVCALREDSLASGVCKMDILITYKMPLHSTVEHFKLVRIAKLEDACTCAMSRTILNRPEDGAENNSG